MVRVDFRCATSRKAPTTFADMMKCTFSIIMQEADGAVSLASVNFGFEKKNGPSDDNDDSGDDDNGCGGGGGGGI